MPLNQEQLDGLATFVCIAQLRGFSAAAVKLGPAEDRIAILMTQRSEYPKTSRLYRDFWNAAN